MFNFFYFVIVRLKESYKSAAEFYKFAKILVAFACVNSVKNISKITWLKFNIIFNKKLLKFF